MFASSEGSATGFTGSEHHGPAVDGATDGTARRGTRPTGTSTTRCSWLRGAHSLVDRAARSADPARPEQLGTPCRRSRFGVDTNGNDPANAMFNDDELPGRVDDEPHRRARPLRAADRAASRRSTAPAGSTPDTGKYVYNGNLIQSSQMDSFGLYAQDSWRLTPTLTLNYGAALGPAAAVHAGERHLVDDDAGGPLRRVGHRQRPGRPRSATCSSPASCRPARTSCRPTSSSTRAIPATRPTGTTSRRTSASRGGRTSRAAGCERCSAIPSRRRSAAATR